MTALNLNGTSQEIFEQFVYDAEKLSGRKIKITIPGKESLLLNTSIVYYNSNYLEKYYEEEYAAKQQGHTRH